MLLCADVLLHGKCCVRLNTGEKPESRGILLIAACSVVVQTLAGLLEVAVTFVSQGVLHSSQVLPVEGAAAQFLPFSLSPGSLHSQQLDIARQRDSPGSKTPGYVPPHSHRPGQTKEGSEDEMLSSILE